MDIGKVEKSFNTEGYCLLTKEYKNQDQKLEYICPNGHKRSTTWKNWKRGRRCLLCKNQSTKPTIDVIKTSFEKEGYILLSKRYINNKTKLDYICSVGHKNSITWADWNSGGYRCPDCANNKRLTISFIKEELNKEGYTLISDNYTNNTTELIVICPEGHEFKTSRVKWTSGNRCPDCHQSRVNIDKVRQSFEDEGYTLLSTEYINAHVKLDFICSNGHKHSITWAAWQQGEKCFYCRNDDNRISVDEIRNILHGYNCTFVENSYSKDGSFNYMCPNGHLCKAYGIGSINYSGIRCAHCYGNARTEFDDIKEEIEKEGYKVLGTVDDIPFRNNRTKLHLICPNGHDYFVSWFDWNTNKVRCYKCKAGTSIQEQDLIDYIKSLGVYIETHDRYLIKPYELDIIIPDKKIAIEYCGLYWHSELAGKDSKYHVNKLEMCERAGYRLLTIFEDEFVNKRDIVLTRINHILNIGSARKIYARKCTIKEIPTDLVSDFCNKFHLQGYAGSSIKIGAFYEDRLVSIMTFSKPSISKGGLDRNNDVWELSRFCSDSGFIVVGTASKLLNFFKKHYVWKSIFSYADRRWSDGNLYKTIGFNFIGNTATSYWYIKKGHIERKHRFMFRKKKDEPLNRTEWSLRKEQGLDRIWDCGNLKYVMHRI